MTGVYFDPDRRAFTSIPTGARSPSNRALLGDVYRRLFPRLGRHPAAVSATRPW
jgi:hypothetical protein